MIVLYLITGLILKCLMERLDGSTASKFEGFIIVLCWPIVIYFLLFCLVSGFLDKGKKFYE